MSFVKVTEAQKSALDLFVSKCKEQGITNPEDQFSKFVEYKAMNVPDYLELYAMSIANVLDALRNGYEVYYTPDQLIFKAYDLSTAADGTVYTADDEKAAFQKGIRTVLHYFSRSVSGIPPFNL